MAGLKRKTHRRSKRKFSKRRHATHISRDIVPKTLARKFTYNAVFHINPPVNGLTLESVYRANGMFDPFAGVGGHQPYGFDQWMQWYDHFTVTSSTIKITAAPIDANQGAYGGILTLRLDDAGDVETGTTHILEMPGTKSKMIGLTSVATLSKSFNAKRFFGGTNKVGAAFYRGDVATDPLEQAYYHIGYSPNLTGAVGGVAVSVQIVYTAVLSERKEVLQS